MGGENFGNNCVHADDTRIDEVTRECHECRQYQQVFSCLAEQRRSEPGADKHEQRQFLQFDLARQETKGQRANCTTYAGPGQHATCRGWRETHVDHEFWHPFQNEVERDDVQEISCSDEQRDG